MHSSADDHLRFPPLALHPWPLPFERWWRHLGSALESVVNQEVRITINRTLSRTSVLNMFSTDIFFDILKNGKCKLDNGSLILQNTEFGYIISGNTSGFSNGSLHCGLITRDFESLSDTLKSFWEVEEFVPTKFVSDELKKCDGHFLKTMISSTNGRFCVEMPMKDSDIELGQSKPTAIRRLKMLERRFVREPDTKDKYVEFLQEYEDPDHM
ncbi:CCHC-type domain-containing protein [Trichonephila inaurata madagascariensis]|uniref:CCHC-type domain-containing protein n=1 Tax=Trichonephila inaurata madagascariensis TaxID=2747483 RepID=A0A8X6WPN5_9ARAC|nr:CCHC-type domain-containing protein [Trichonephila inaurata madagascariensis]